MSGPLGSSQWMHSTGAASFFTETIDNSVRLVGSGTPANGGRFTQTFSTVDSSTDFTLNFWLKRNEADNPVNSSYAQNIFNFRSGTSGSVLNDIAFAGSTYAAGDQILITDTNSANPILATSNLLSDFSAWYNIHIMADMDNSTASERLKIFINGTEASYAVDNRSSYSTFAGLVAGAWTIGDYYGTAYCIGSTIARWAFVDNSTLAASYFGEFSNGIWVPKAISGITWGSAGHLLDFGQTGTSQDASGIGADTSGQGNHWAVNNIAATDILIDTPSNNFACLNPLYHSSSKAVLSEGNLKADTAGFVNAANGYGAVSTFAIPKDKKIYIEVECTDGTSDNWFAGFASQSGLESGPSSTNTGGANAITVYNRSVMINGSETDYGSSAGLGGLGVAKLASGDILGCMCDGATGKVWFSRNGSYFKSPSTNDSGTTGDPAGGNHEIGTITNGTTEDVFFVLGGNTSVSSIFVNFGQDTVNVASANADANGIGTFEYAPPTDYVCLCASSLSELVIGPNSDTQADDHFATVLYTGNATARSITVGFQPDWVWFKPRSDTDNHVVFDSVRGVQKFIYVNGTGVEGTRSGDGLSSFDSNGFSIGDWNNLNESSQTYVAWNWKAGGSASSNSDGSTTSSVSANTDAGFSILTYTADAATGTVGHGLNSAPELVIGRPRSDTNWYVMHTPGGVVPANNILNLDSNAAAFNPGANHFNDTYPTSTVVNYGGYMGNDLSNDNKLMYCFHSVEGYSKVGSFLGNGSSQFVYLGFRPAFVLWKRTNSSGWNISDSVRDPFNEVSAVLHPNTTASETTASQDILFVSNGFVEAGYANDSGTTSIYWAIAEAPFKYANAR